MVLNISRSNYFVIYFFLLCLHPAFLQHTYTQKDDQTFRVAFYNVENFFDASIDSTREYNAFTPEGEQRWTLTRYVQKRMNVYKTIMAIGEGRPPGIIGFCEVENEKVLHDLVFNTPLKSFQYRVVHYESPDRRGIDVALAYRKEGIVLLSSRSIRVRDASDTAFVTRDILYAKFEISGVDTLHVFINHWPSRYGGVLASVDKRKLVARLLRHHVDSLNNTFNTPKILIMGDFNDEPDDQSIVDGLGAFPIDQINSPNQLVNLFTLPDQLGSQGTIKYMQNWQIFDQIIVSQSLMCVDQRLCYRNSSARIFLRDFLLTDDDRHLGKMLFRTFSGPSYIGGYSDHLPVYIDLDYKK
jgi:endonuclease/exonuclease/phosphatase family metal-dependent hydrolase